MTLFRGDRVRLQGMDYNGSLIEGLTGSVFEVLEDDEGVSCAVVKCDGTGRFLCVPHYNVLALDNNKEAVMKPTVGRIVHYYQEAVREEPGSHHQEVTHNLVKRAAIITRVETVPVLLISGEEEKRYRVDIELFGTTPDGHLTNGGSRFMRQDVPYSSIPQASHWSWPEREAA